MTTTITATVECGMLKPDHRLPFAEHTRVKLTIEPIDDRSSAAAMAAWQAIMARLRERPLHFGGQRYTRDELHERR